MKHLSRDIPPDSAGLANPAPAFDIIPFAPEYETTLKALGEDAGMGTLEGFERTAIARSAGGNEVLGFCRIRVFDDVAYVNPLVTAPQARGMGVGRALMLHCADLYGELRLVARGYAVPFYRSIGCTDAAWQDIAPEMAGDCPACPDAATCNPQPMKLVVSNSAQSND